YCGPRSSHWAEPQSLRSVIDAEAVGAQHVQTNYGVNSPRHCLLDRGKVLYPDWNVFDPDGTNRDEWEGGKLGLNTPVDHLCLAIALLETESNCDFLIDHARVGSRIDNEGQLFQIRDRPLHDHNIIPVKLNGELDSIAGAKLRSSCIPAAIGSL